MSAPVPAERELRRDQGLAYQDRLASRFLETAESLKANEWERPTNCPPWTVKMLVGHVARGGETFRRWLDLGAQGVMDAPISPEDRARREREIAAMDPAGIISMLESTQSALRARLAALGPDELERPTPHTRGIQPAWWFVDQRLAELAFHGWDLGVSLAREREIDADVAQHLLPTLLERNIRTWFRHGPSGTGRWGIGASDIEGGRWLVEPSDGEISVTRSSADADITIEGDAPALIRWLYGRADLEQLVQGDRVTIGGQRDRLSAWREMFPAP